MTLNSPLRRIDPWSVNFPIRPGGWPFFYGWLLIGGSALGMLGSMPGQTIGFSVFIEILMRELKLTRDQISLSYMVGTILSGLTLPYGGTLLDRFGARKTMVLASAGLGCICLYFSQIDRIAEGLGGLLRFAAPGMIASLTVGLGFYCIRFTGQGMMALGATTMLGKWFNHRRGLTLGLRGLVTALGFSLTPLVLNGLLETVGWRESYWVLAATCGFGMALLAYVFYRDNPEECGLQMDGGYIPAGGKPRIEDLVIYRDYTRKEALRTFSYWVYSTSLCLSSFLISGYAFHVVSIGETLLMENNRILALFLPITCISIPTNLFFGWLSDRTRLRYLLMGMTLAQILTGLSFLFLPGFVGEVLLIIGMGVSSGGFVSLSGIFLPRYFGRRHLGAINGFHLSSAVIISALGPIVFSRIFTETGSYAPSFIFSGIVALGLFMSSFFVHNPQRKARVPKGDDQEREE